MIAAALPPGWHLEPQDDPTHPWRLIGPDTAIDCESEAIAIALAWDLCGS